LDIGRKIRKLVRDTPANILKDKDLAGKTLAQV
jgi:hypothetical protein